MMTPIILLMCFLSARGLPIQYDPSTTLSTITDYPTPYQQDISVVSYIQNFKNIMAEYVVSQYKNLTTHETEKVKEVLEEFLTKFANDLRQAVEKQHKNEYDDAEEDREVEDGVPDQTFEEIKGRVRSEFPDISERTADEIVFKLRKNLFETRQKLDKIIKESQIAQIEFAQD